MYIHDCGLHHTRESGLGIPLDKSHNDLSIIINGIYKNSVNDFGHARTCAKCVMSLGQKSPRTNAGETERESQRERREPENGNERTKPK